MKALLRLNVLAMIAAAVLITAVGCRKNAHRGDGKRGVRVSHEGGKLKASIGLESMGGLFEPILRDGAVLPVASSMDFSTATDNQAVVDVRVLQGYSSLARKNVELATYKLTGLPSVPRGVPHIRVTLSVNENGVFTLDADELYSGKKPKVVEVSRNELSEDEATSLRSQSEATLAADEQQAALIRAQNEAELALYMGRKLLAGGYRVEHSKEDAAGIKALMADVIAARSDATASDLSASARSLRSAVESLLNR